jgi:hypothetical protein
VTVVTSLESRIIGSFHRFRDLPATPALNAFRKPLVGELLGDTNQVAETFDPAFEVVMHSGDTTVTLPGSVIVESVRGEAAAAVVMWTEFDDLVIDGDSIPANGALLRLPLPQRTLSSVPVGLFVRFKGGRMISEVVFKCGPTETIDVSTQEMPSVHALRAGIDSRR